MPTPKASPALLERFERLAGCRGAWILDLRDADNRGYDLHHVPGYVYGVGNLTPAEALQHCVDQRWSGCRLLFSPETLNDDCSWPGGYDAPSHYRSNARVFREDHAKALELADGDADGTALDLRYVTAEMLEAIEALEAYPILDEDDHSQLELDCQAEAWECWTARDWHNAIRDKLAEFAPESADFPECWADDQLDAIPDDKLNPQLLDLFNACADQTCTYWQEESDGGFWIDVARAAAAVDRQDLVDLTGLPLLPPDQEWRREPYPWPDGSTDSLAPALV